MLPPVLGWSGNSVESGPHLTVWDEWVLFDSFFFQSLVYFVIVSKRKHFQNYDGVELASDLPSQSLDAYLILIRC